MRPEASVRDPQSHKATATGCEPDAARGPATVRPPRWMKCVSWLSIGNAIHCLRMWLRHCSNNKGRKTEEKTLLESSKTCSDFATGILLHQGLSKNMAPILSLKCQVPTILAYPLGSKIDIPQNPSLLAKNIINFPGKRKHHVWGDKWFPFVHKAIFG